MIDYLQLLNGIYDLLYFVILLFTQVFICKHLQLGINSMQLLRTLFSALKPLTSGSGAHFQYQQKYIILHSLKTFPVISRHFCITTLIKVRFV
jgi:hypothetical protein